jgi:hypothetical protein
MTRTGRATALTATVLLWTASPSGAAVHVPSDYGTIWQAIDASAAGDTVLVGPGHWTATDTRVVQLGSALRTVTSCGFLKGGLTIIGETGASQTIVDAGGGEPPADKLYTFLLANESGGPVVVEGLTITGAGHRSSAVLATQSESLVLRSCDLVQNEPSGPGGFVVLMDATDLLVEDCTLSYNVATTCISSGQGSLEIRESRFEGNMARTVRGGGSGERAIITDCEFIGNRGECHGTVSLGPMESVVVERNLFLRNVVFGTEGCEGGGLTVGYSHATIAFNTFAFDSSSQVGGGLELSACPVAKVIGNTFYGCHAVIGSAVVVAGPSDVDFSNNIVSNSTGGAALISQFEVGGGCNDYWNNEGGDFFYEWFPSETDLFEDPLFCDAEALWFELRENSPCAPGVTEGCGQIGVSGVGCGTVSVEPRSWGRIKALFREEDRP